MRFSYAAHTHLGQQRPHNEDNYFVLEEDNLFVVADGMGGHRSGEVASAIAVEALANYFIETENSQIAEWPFPLPAHYTYDECRLSCGIRQANLRVYQAAQQGEQFEGMGTTIVCMVLGSTGAFLAHVGDSRGYVVRPDGIEQLTEDHSLVNEMIKAEKLTLEEAKRFAHKNVIVRALGLGDDVEVDIGRLMPQPGETYLLCSDGLTDLVTDDEILEIIMTTAPDIGAASQALSNRANEAGGIDNITIVMVSFTD